MTTTNSQINKPTKKGTTMPDSLMKMVIANSPDDESTPNEQLSEYKQPEYKLLGPDHNPKPQEIDEEDYSSSFIGEMMDDHEIYEIIESAKRGDIPWSDAYMDVACIYSRLFLQDEYLRLYIEKAHEHGDPNAKEILKDNTINRDLLDQVRPE